MHIQYIQNIDFLFKIDIIWLMRSLNLIINRGEIHRLIYIYTGSST